MPRRTAICISGTGPNSLGAELATVFRYLIPDVPIIAIDRHHDPRVTQLSHLCALTLDLNPWRAGRTYDGLVSDLSSGLQQARRVLGFDGLHMAILSAGVYAFGPLAAMSVDQRQRLVGVNVSGKIELLSAILACNEAAGCNSSKLLTVIELGALHSLRASARRSLYAATKRAGLELIASLLNGGEVSRAICIAPGPIDTPMLHRNHWVTKEGGSTSFFDNVLMQDSSLYRAIFMSCDDNALAAAIPLSPGDDLDLRHTFARYKVRRQEQINSPNGVLPVSDASQRIADIALNDADFGSGIYILTAPQGVMQMTMQPFVSATDDIRR